jgi:hypothetical protein
VQGTASSPSSTTIIMVPSPVRFVKDAVATVNKIQEDRRSWISFCRDNRNRKISARYQSGGDLDVAERVGFEPTIPKGIRALQARALGQTMRPLHNMYCCLTIVKGGEGGIRTLEGRKTLRVFETRALGQTMRPLRDNSFVN